MLLLHVRFAREDAAKRGATLAVPELADTLRRLGYSVKIRTALGGGPGGACLRSLRHSFLTVSVAGPSGSMSYVLDPRFREQVGGRVVAGGYDWRGGTEPLLRPAEVPLHAGLLLEQCCSARLAFPYPLPSTRASAQFEIAHATPRYARVLEAVGPEVVGSQDRLNKVRLLRGSTAGGGLKGWLWCSGGTAGAWRAAAAPSACC